MMWNTMINCIVFHNKCVSIIFPNWDVMVPPLSMSFILFIMNLLYSSSIWRCWQRLRDLHLGVDFFSSFAAFLSYTFPTCFYIVSNFICNFTTLPSFQLHEMHLTSCEVSFSFVGGIDSIHGYLETQSTLNFLPASHWPFFLFRECNVPPCSEKSSTFSIFVNTI